jgi:adenine-specific DNA-methyltransferase
MHLQRVQDPILAWSGRHSAFIATADGGHRVIPSNDPRALLVYPIETTGHVGETNGRSVLIEADARDALRALRAGAGIVPTSLPIRLAYLDPPFNTQERWAHYNDTFDHNDWLTMMDERLREVSRLLAEDGSVWVHCDDREQAYLRVLLDEIFGREAFIATVVWQRRYSRDNRRAIGPVHDYIHVYAPLGLRWKDKRNRLPRRDKPGSWSNPDGDPLGPWATYSLVAQGGHGTPAQWYEIETPSGRLVSPPVGSCWRVTRERFEELQGAGRIWFGKGGGNVPRRKVYLSEAQGLVPWTWWPHEEVGHNEEARREMRRLFPNDEPFLTPKPERLLERIIRIATHPGDTVLDCFLGSGTTAAVAHKMNRNWIGVEVLPETIETYALPRLRSVVAGTDRGGISNDYGWIGGGGFAIARLAPASGSRLITEAEAVEPAIAAAS